MISRYDAYKDSRVEWIGEIPEHWEMIKLKYLGKALIGLSYQPEEIVDDETQGILVLRSSNIQNGKLSLLDNVYVKSKVKEDLKVKEGDILICSRNGSRSLIGKNITISKDLVGNTFGAFMTVLRTPNYKFISKVFNSRVFSEQSGLFLTSTINQLTQETLNNFLIPFTLLEHEQTQIVSYLDEKTALIDKLISVKQRKIELLKEKRTALINHAVTKGLNPNVKMKDSGIEWIGEIPEHWGYKKTTHCFGLIGSGTTPTSNNPEYYEDGEINWLQTGDLNDGIISKTSKLITQKAFDDVNLKLYPANSLIIAMYGATIGKVGLLKIETTTNQACCVLAQPRGVFVNYIFYWFISNKDKIVSLAYGGGQPNISQETIKSLRIHCPPIPEQTQIVTYLDEKTKEIDDLLNIEQKKIDLLKEYRQSLISEVVTGKIKVTTD
ncbi:MAG: restriction endonuclease subunit S [Bacteroidetes bacterium]|nr:restriction endonuclease subunit S [Bacteroidota bacterium]